MRSFRKAIFWIHLAIGLLAGGVVLIMSVTGVLMAFERQLTRLADGFHLTPPPGGLALGVEAHLEKLREAKKTPSALVLDRDPTMPVIYQFGKEDVVFANPYTGESLGAGNTSVRGFFRFVVGMHRWLAQEGPARPVGKAIVGTANVLFLFLIVSGIYLWFPKKWTWPAFKAVTLFKKRLKGRARDWNWHHVFGIWAALPLLVIVGSGTVIAWPWATALVYQIAGESPPAAGEKRKPAASPTLPDPTGLDTALAVVKTANPNWQTIQLQLPPGKVASFGVAESHRGRPDKRRQITVELASTRILKTEGLESMSPGKQARTWIRWIHTGEAGGLAGQSVAALAAASSGVLVWTGFALSWRRLKNRKRVAA